MAVSFTLRHRFSARSCRLQLCLSSALKCFGSAVTAAALVLVIPWGGTADTLMQVEFDSYFADLQQRITTIASSSVIKKSALSPVDAYFVAQLKKTQPIYSLIRTNSKGVIINEVVRGQKPSRDYRSIATQPWFKAFNSSYDPYFGFVKEENGRYYMFWAQAIVTRDNRFRGAVAAKIDLWDCFHKLSSEIERPFLVRLGTLSLYSHKWEKGHQNQDYELTIPGIQKITLRMFMSETAAREDSATAVMRKDTGAVAGPVFGIDSSIRKPAAKKTGFPFVLKFGKFRLAILGLLLITIPGALIFRFVVWFKNWRLMKRIEREDRF
jgi:hypothetical protein